MIHWLFLDLDSYFASCEQQARPDLRGKPVGVVPMMAETTCCLAASREAKKRGIKTGTRVADARLLCPEITFVVARHDLYTLYHKTIVEAVESCLPIDSVLSIDEMICDLKGSQRELAHALALADKIKTTLRERVGDFLTCSIGLAANRFLAKVASDMNKPNGLTVRASARGWRNVWPTMESSLLKRSCACRVSRCPAFGAEWWASASTTGCAAWTSSSRTPFTGALAISMCWSPSSVPPKALGGSPKSCW